jgi:hypothetical protein
MTPPDVGQLPTPAGWNRDTGEWERAARAERAEESGRLREPGYSFEDDFPAGPVGGSGPWPAASAVPGPPSAASTAGAGDAAGAAGAGKPERHSHRASKHGRPSRRRGSSDRPGRDGES